MGPGLIAAVVVLLFAGASFFFALAETALFSLTQWQVRQLAERQPRSGNIVVKLLSQPQDLLATMVLGNTFATAAMLATALWMALNGRWWLSVTIGVLLTIILIGCEVLPKTLAVRKPERWALRIAAPLRFLQAFMMPLTRIGQRLGSAILAAPIPKTMQSHQALTAPDYQDPLVLPYPQHTLT